MPRGRKRAKKVAGRAERAPVREKPQQIADELRRLIMSGALSNGELLGREPELVERFGVSRPSLREALRILEAKGLISVVRGRGGGIVVHEPDERIAAHTAALVLQARNVSVADVHEARTLLEVAAVRVVASLRSRRSAVSALQERIAEQIRVIMDPDAFGPANAQFHEQLVTLAGNRTLSIVAEMLHEIVARAVTAVGKTGAESSSLATRRRSIRSQQRLVSLIEAGNPSDAEAHWRTHMAIVGRLLLGQRAATVIDLIDYQ